MCSTYFLLPELDGFIFLEIQTTSRVSQISIPNPEGVLSTFFSRNITIGRKNGVVN